MISAGRALCLAKLPAAFDIAARHSWRMFKVRKTLLVAVIAVLASCGDPDTTDKRGYTKAPLEKPTVLVQGEPTTEMSGLGRPQYPSAPVIPAEPDTAGQAQAGGQAGGQTGGQAAAGTAPEGATAADVSAGKTIFTSTGNCFTCHGQNGEGSGLAPALNDGEWLHVDGSWASLQQIITSGVPAPQQFPAPMPAKGGAALTDEQVRQVAAYVYSLSH